MSLARHRSADISKGGDFEVDEEEQDLVQPFHAGHRAPARPSKARYEYTGVPMVPVGSSATPSASGSSKQLEPSRASSDLAGTPVLAQQIKGLLVGGADEAASASSSSQSRRVRQEDDGGALDLDVIPPRYNPDWAPRGGSL